MDTFPELCPKLVLMCGRQLAGVTAGLQAAVKWVQDGVCANLSTVETTVIAVRQATTDTHNALVHLYS